MKDRLTIALQKSGRLSNESQEVLKKSGVKFQTRDSKLLIKSNSFPVDILFVRDDDIPNLVNNGDADLAIIGQNELLEKTLSKNLNQINTLLKLGFSKCRLSFAIPEGVNFESLKDMKIATSYPNIVQNYLNKNFINANVSDIHGSVELMPHIGICDCICDLVSSGATLEANNLKELDTIMHSEAVLISNNNIKKSKLKLADTLTNRIKGVINARESKYVMLNAPLGNVDKICKLLPGSESPTIIPLENKDKVAIHSLCQEPVFWGTMEELKANGASSILVLPVEKVLS
ncbi:ATP phosphoribosyltransferase [Gammaproteobacteria bacterium]|jgi:ATP phosphoribosyltransferase|nr:ATP phosphoribosyltransferase [Gammaproteobacteria bacterium]MDC3248549.1 ATP phosphoribosyltransferase [Gammaproteobacteria bacterium]MDC3302166.1 ATP phosphoribosyltransferase [Gammaproteobacteria bacterium]